jgi:cytochrome P450
VRAAQSLIDRFVNQVIELRRSGDDDANDLLAMLLAARDEATGEGMSNQQLYDEIRTIFVSGYDSTSNVLAWLWYVLARHPEIEQRVRHEISEQLGQRTPTFHDLAGLPYLRMVIQETMRIYPPVWSTARTVVADDEIDGYQIPAGAKVIISPYITHRLPALWEHPERFDPERFTPERSADRHQCAYIPFSVGPRLCIGSNLAMMEAQLIAAMVIQRHQLRLTPGCSVQLNPSLILQPRKPIMMQLQLR